MSTFEACSLPSSSDLGAAFAGSGDGCGDETSRTRNDVFNHRTPDPTCASNSLDSDDDWTTRKCTDSLRDINSSSSANSSFQSAQDQTTDSSRPQSSSSNDSQDLVMRKPLENSTINAVAPAVAESSNAVVNGHKTASPLSICDLEDFSRDYKPLANGGDVSDSESEAFVMRVPNSKLDKRSQDFMDSNLMALAAQDEVKIGHYEQALLLYDLATNLNPSDWRLYLNRAIVRQTLEDFKGSLKDAEMAVRLAPHNSKSHWIKSASLKFLGRYSEAEEALRQAKCCDPLDCRFDEEMIELRRTVLWRLLPESKAKVYADEIATNSSSVNEAIKNSINLKLFGDENRSRTSSVSSEDGEDVQTITKDDELNNLVELSIEEVKRVEPPPVSSWTSTLNPKAPLFCGVLSCSRGTSTSSDTELTMEVKGSDSDVEETIDESLKPFPQNIFEYEALLVGNIRADLDEDYVRKVFERFGVIKNVTFGTPRSRHVVIEFGGDDASLAPSKAIHELFGTKMHQSNAINKKLFFRFVAGRGQKVLTRPKRVTRECLLWRTTGCNRELIGCTKEHLDICRGVDFNDMMLNGLCILN